MRCLSQDLLYTHFMQLLKSDFPAYVTSHIPQLLYKLNATLQYMQFLYGSSTSSIFNEWAQKINLDVNLETFIELAVE